MDLIIQQNRMGDGTRKITEENLADLLDLLPARDPDQGVRQAM